MESRELERKKEKTEERKKSRFFKRFQETESETG
jgi:hypothetical protein